MQAGAEGYDSISADFLATVDTELEHEAAAALREGNPYVHESPTCDRMAASVVDDMPVEDFNCAFEFLQAVLREGEPVTTGSIFTGSEAAHDMLMSVLRVFARRSGVSVEVVHMMCVEAEAWKRRWILDTKSPRHLFAEASDLSLQMAFDWASGQMQPIPRCKWISLGFVCRNWSTLFSNRSAFSRAVADDFGVSGKTCRYGLAHARCHLALELSFGFVLQVVQGGSLGGLIVQ